jgi:hypothetical protein
MAFRAGTRRAWIAVAVGVALIGALVALQLVDDDDTGRRSSDRTLQVKGASASRPASLVGRFTGADGFTVEVRVVTPDGESHATVDPDGRFRVTDLAPGPVEVSWVGATTADAGGGVILSAQRAGHTEVRLDAGRNSLELEL